MGYNTAVMLLNDHIDGLNTDTGFGPRLHDSILESSRPEYRGRGKSLPLGHCGNGAMVLESQHADNVQIVAVGGNCMIPLGTLWGAWRHMTEPEKLLKSLADQMGYRLVRKPQR